MKIAIVHPWNQAKWIFPLMHDGLKAAMNLIGQKHQVDWFLQGDEPDKSYDWILPWGVGSLPFNNTIEKFKGRKALICAGHPQDTANFDKFEAIFVESPQVYEQIRAKGYRTILAFGTDTDFFKPRDEKKMFDAFFPATFSPWKRQSLFAHAVKDRGMACGFVQPDGGPELLACEENNTYTMTGLIPTRLVSQMYNMTNSVVITAWHGSERTALEAMASNVPLVVTKDNDLTCSLLTDECIKVDPSNVRKGFLEALGRKVNTREHILENYSHVKYAQKLLKVLEA